MKITDKAMVEGPFALVVIPHGPDKDVFVVAGEIPEKGLMPLGIYPFSTKKRALEVAQQYEGEFEGDDTGEIIVVSLRDAGFLKRFMSM
jgi:hypothetical protein